ncbi:tryptophan halogenase [Sphingopyxis sp. Root1497]|nr:tryptophan halogenase [Sphingopyxis sp. Root1497]
MTAAALAKLLPGQADIQLIESEEIGIVGVGEATLPHLREFIRRLGLDEMEFMRTTRATFKLGIDFVDFGAIGERYIHPFGAYGTDIAGVGFHHYWLRMQAAGQVPPICDFSLPIVAARGKRFAPVPEGGDLLDSSYSYAYQFDATRMAPMLRRFAEAHGTRRTEGKVVAVERDGASGDVARLRTDRGDVIGGDLFIDCSGFRALLIGETLKSPWEDWSEWLPCDRAAALPCAAPDGPIEPYTRATAMPAGWRWRIPLQHRVGNGYVFSSNHVSEDEACAAILGAVEGEPLADPRVLRFRAGRRTKSWDRNVVAIGLASGFLEPLESTSIHLVQQAVTRLVELFPERRIDPADRDSFNALVDREYDRIRDFLILHYHATRRDDSDFWSHVRTMALPDELARKMALWKESGRVELYTEGLFLEASWIAVYLGQGVVPQGYDQRADIPPQDRIAASLAELGGAIRQRVAAWPDHAEYLRQAGAWEAA